MRVPRVSPHGYRRITLFATVALGVIIVTGAAVRLTGSGLGCPDWPQCDEQSLVAPLEYHAMIEFVNRVATGLVSVAVILAVLGSVFRVPRRRDLIWLSAGLVAGVIGQIVLGGLTVLFDLKPPFVMAHFLLSLVILANALVLHRRAGDPGPLPPSPYHPSVQRATWTVMGLACVVVTTGTVVTATGPHGGDENAERFGFELASVARVHGVSVTLLVIATFVLAALARRHHAPAPLPDATRDLLVVLFLQGGVGYVQYFADVPVGLVATHVVGAVAVWVLTVRLVLTLHRPTSPPVGIPPGDAVPAPAASDADPDAAGSPGDRVPEPVAPASGS